MMPEELCLVSDQVKMEHISVLTSSISQVYIEIPSLGGLLKNCADTCFVHGVKRARRCYSHEFGIYFSSRVRFSFKSGTQTKSNLSTPPPTAPLHGNTLFSKSWGFVGGIRLSKSTKTKHTTLVQNIGDK